jgi:hypothetical protein
MKKIVFVLIFSATFALATSSGQTILPIIGYDKVGWGSSIETVKQAYPEGMLETNSDDKSIGVREFEQLYVGGGIEARKFYFFNDKLYRVFVYYGELSSPEKTAIANKLVASYGKFNDSDETKSVYQNNLENITRYYWRISLFLTIIATELETYNSYGYHIGSEFAIVYISPLIDAQVDAERTKKQNDKIQL